MQKKAYEAPALKVHGSVEEMTQWTGGSNTEMVFGSPPAIGSGNCSTSWSIGNTGCFDLGS